jgi:hypothetical protein
LRPASDWHREDKEKTESHTQEGETAGLGDYRDCDACGAASRHVDRWRIGLWTRVVDGKYGIFGWSQIVAEYHLERDVTVKCIDRSALVVNIRGDNWV